MKTPLSRLSYYFACFVLIIYGCASDENIGETGDEATNTIITLAKEWHRQQTQNEKSLFGRLDNTKRLILTPKFNLAKVHTLSGGRKVLYAPAMDFEFENKSMAFLRGFVFDVKDNQIVDGRIVEFYANSRQINQQRNSLLEQYAIGRLTQFSGSIISYDVNYNYVNGKTLRRGSKTSENARLGYKLKDEKNQRSSGRTMDGYMMDVYLVNYWSDGSETWYYMYSYCVGCGNSGGENPGGGYPVDQGGSPAPPPADADYVYNEVTDPCIASQVQNAIGSNMINNISQVFQQYFGVNDSYNVWFEQTTDLASTVDGDATASKSPGFDGLNVTISLNENVLPSASAEYVMATVYHEMIHAILFYQGIDMANAQHASMANSYVSSLASALQSAFPSLSSSDATNLAWGGLQGTAAFNALSNAQQSAINNTNASYRTRQSGTNCN